MEAVEEALIPEGGDIEAALGDALGLVEGYLLGDEPSGKRRRTDEITEASSDEFASFAASLLADDLGLTAAAATKPACDFFDAPVAITFEAAATPSPSTTIATTPPAAFSGNDTAKEETDAEREARRKADDKRRRNRESAFKSRKRKVDAIKDLSARVSELERALRDAHAENAELRTCLARAAAAGLTSEGAGGKDAAPAPRETNTTKDHPAPAVRQPLPWVMVLTFLLPLISQPSLAQRQAHLLSPEATARRATADRCGTRRRLSPHRARTRRLAARKHARRLRESVEVFGVWPP